MKNKRNKSLAVIILASGSGVRMKNNIPKQYLKIRKKTLLEENIIKFSSLNIVKKLIVVVNYKHKKYFNSVKENYKKISFIFGSKTRQESCYKGLKYLEKDPYTYVFVHDASRPFISQELIKNLYKKILIKKSAVIPVIAINDSIKSVNNNIVLDSLDRKKIYLSQTPQIFNYKLLLNAYKLNKNKLEQFTDDAQIFSLTSNKVFTIKGSIDNIKVTTKQQWEMLRKMTTKEYEIKIGQGFDTHKLVKGRNIVLFGLKIPSTYSLLGHSDADVGIHSIIDALLGSLALGDIGIHFPNTKKKYKGISSLLMLQKVNELISSNYAEISHIDCTLIGEKPKISKYSNKMRNLLAKTLKIPVKNISIKATTTEGLGFTGRLEGISCSCTATVKKYIKNE